jgi:glycosyl transferase family 25
MEYIDKVVFINLDKRTDRRQEIENELTHLGVMKEKWIRFPAVEHTQGWIGCLKSHKTVLQLALDSNWSNVLILEDDFMATVSPSEFQDELHRYFTSNTTADVVFLSYNIQKQEPFNEQMGRTTECQTASGYLVMSHYYKTILQNLTEAEIRASHYPSHHWRYANDQYWKQLQKKDIWLYFQKRLGKQRPGFSDLGGCLVDRGV